MSSPQRWTRGVAPRWSVTPPTPRVKKYERLPILPGKGESVIVVSSALEETLTHYVDSRTQPCTGADGQCWVDHRLVGNPRYSGWLVVKLDKQLKPWLLSVTKVSVSVEPKLRDPNLNLRGLTMRVWRTGNHERSELHAALQLHIPRITDLPPCPDVRFLVERLWEAEDRPKVAGCSKPGIFSRAFAAAGKAVE